MSTTVCPPGRDDITALLEPSGASSSRDSRGARTSWKLHGSGLVGTELGGYAIRRLMGGGASGLVYLADQINLQRPVALKVLNSRCARNPEYLLRFQREARAVARLVHPNAVQVYEIGEADGYHFIALEYVSGQSLAEVLRLRGCIPWRAALEIVRQAACSLQMAHEMGIVHRDIKPANLLVGHHAVVKLADFGLARLFDAPSITEESTILGTPHYMSPEQAQGEPAGPAADIYSLGATLYHMLAGQPPFKAPSTPELLRKHVVEPPRAPRELAAEVPKEVSDLALQMLAKSPEDRPASAAILRERLRLLAEAAATTGPTAPPAPPERAEPASESASASDPAIPPGAAAGNAQRTAAAAGLAAALSPEEIQELLACEATCICLLPRPRKAFLLATMRNYRIPQARMAPFLNKTALERDDVWLLQMLKRSAQGDARAVRIVDKLRRLEQSLGGPLRLGPAAPSD